MSHVSRGITCKQLQGQIIGKTNGTKYGLVTRNNWPPLGKETRWENISQLAY